MNARQIEKTIVVTKEQFREAIKIATGIDLENLVVNGVNSVWPDSMGLIEIRLVDSAWIAERNAAQQAEVIGGNSQPIFGSTAGLA